MQRSFRKRKYKVVISSILIIVAVICLLPFIHTIAISFSSSSAVGANYVSFWPVNFTLTSYEYVMHRSAFWRSFVVSLERIALGGGITMILVLMMAYPLSKEPGQFKARTAYVWIIFITMLFNGGLIPLYMLVSQLKMMDTLWSLVLPCAVPAFSVILMLNFFRQIPRELEEAAYIDGASHWKIFMSVFIPVSAPAIATIALFTIVGHWNSWFDGLIFMNRPEHMPLQSYLQTVIVAGGGDMSKSPEDWKIMSFINDRTIKCSQIIMATIPILIVYPFLQKYFVTGIVLGSVKG
jgi:putative aldouronate transport system permease protein